MLMMPMVSRESHNEHGASLRIQCRGVFPYQNRRAELCFIIAHPYQLDHPIGSFHARGPHRCAELYKRTGQKVNWKPRVVADPHPILGFRFVAKKCGSVTKSGCNGVVRWRERRHPAQKTSVLWGPLLRTECP